MKSCEVTDEAPSHYGASAKAIRHHYDVGTAFFRLWLDRNLVYSAARWTQPIGAPVPRTSLEEAQIAKLDFHLDAARAGKDSRLLDIGCGWGGMLRRAVEHRQVAHATGLTLSEDQFRHVAGLDLPRTDVRLENYESFQPHQTYSSIVCVGAMEHFARPGYDSDTKMEAYRGFFARCHRWLGNYGHLSIQSICWGAVPRAKNIALLPLDIFPESDLPYLSEILESAAPHFELKYIENGRLDYIMTLYEWLRRLREQKEVVTRDFGGEPVFSYYERYLRRAIAGFERKRMTLYRMVLQRS
jgi:cyclopropane-fatty-acyl-phospholipid synthase